MATLFVDFETYSDIDLRQCGVSRYAASPLTGIMCMAWAVDDGPVCTWVPGEPAPRFILLGLPPGSRLIAHNAAFDRAIWNVIGTKTLGLPLTPLREWDCTMARAYAMALPPSLEKLAPALGLSATKDMAGNRLVMQMCRPRSWTDDGAPVWWWQTDPGKVQRMREYAAQDCEVLREVHRRLLPLSDRERRVWLLDQRINSRGIYLDEPAVLAATAVVKQQQATLDMAMRATTAGEVHSCNDLTALRGYVQRHVEGFHSLSKDIVATILERDELPGDVRRALLLRQEAGKASVAKLRAMLRGRSETDYRLREMLQYHAASTGRWGGRRVQIQNMPRPKYKQEQIERALTILCAMPAEEAAFQLDLFIGPPLTVLSSCLRGLLRAAPGHELLAADFSAIEARGLAWLAGEESVLDIFRGHGKIYEAAAAAIYDVAIEDVSSEQRQIGKVGELSLGYQGAVGAFHSMAANYGVHVDDATALMIVKRWRAKRKRTVNYWYAAQDAAIDAIRHPGSTFAAGPKEHPDRQIKFRKLGSFLWCRLPSGRAICYPYPRLVPSLGRQPAIVYKTVGLTRDWDETSLYGGKIVENVTQALCRDLLVDAMFRVEQAGYPIIFHVHDEIVAEVPSGTGDLAEFEALCGATPMWAKDLPTAASGWRGQRYRK